MSAEPTLLQLAFDSITEIKIAVAKLGEQQSAQMMLMEQQRSAAHIAAAVLTQQSDTQLANSAAIYTEIDELRTKVEGLTRVGWLLSIVGAIVMAVMIGVLIEVLGSWATGGYDAPDIETVKGDAIINKGGSK